jgi:hypothetical protein
MYRYYVPTLIFKCPKSGVLTASSDLACLCERLLIEVDGPSHFVKDGQGWVPNGATRMKRRHLSASGYRLVSVPFFEWNEEMDKAAYLRSKLYTKPGKGWKRDQQQRDASATQRIPVAPASSESASHWQTMTRKTKQYKKT